MTLTRRTVLASTFAIGLGALWRSPDAAAAEPGDFSDPCPVRPTVTPFGSSLPVLDMRANAFWTLYGLAETDGDPYGKRFGLNSAWTEWDALKFAWTARGGYRDQARAWLLDNSRVNGYAGISGRREPGFVWSWANLETWPDTNSYHGGVGSYHYDQIPRFVAAAALHYLWTRDQSFLSAVMPKVRLVMRGYLLDILGGRDGVLTIPHTSNDGTPTARPSTYMDQVKSGHQDSWVNAAFHTALHGMADLEHAAGDHGAARMYGDLAAAFPDRFDDAFWTGERYAGWRDVTGRVHDSGYALVTVEALGRGLGDASRAAAVFDWLAKPAQPIAFGPHIGSTDVYHNVIAPRTTTISVPQADWDGWSDPAEGRKPYGDLVEDGGTALWLAYYDVMARLRHRDADDALAVLSTTLARIASDSHCLTFNPAAGRFWDDFGESLVQIGTNDPFPESGIAVLPLLYGFVGAEATREGLTITPNLPRALVNLSVSSVNYAGEELTVAVSRGQSVAAAAPDAAGETVDPGGTAREFDCPNVFDEIGVCVTAPSARVAVSVGLERQDDSGWRLVASQRFTGCGPTTWLSLGCTPQGRGRYRITLEDNDGPLSWNRGPNGLAYRAVQTFRAGATVAVGREFVAALPFTRLGVRAGGGPVVVTLRRQVSGHWRTVREVTVPRIGVDGDVVVSLAAQPVGSYRVEVDGHPVDTVRLEREMSQLRVPERGLAVMVAPGGSHVVRS